MSRTVTVPLDQIHLDNSLYPRKRPSDEIIAAYRAAIDDLPPIQLAERDGQFVLVDGYHRLLAHRREQRAEIAAEVGRYDDILVAAIEANARHGYQLSPADKRDCGKLLYTRAEAPITELPALASLLGLSLNTIRQWKWYSDIQAAQDEERDRLIREMWLDCHSEQEIADKVGIPRRTVDDRLAKLTESAESPSAPASLQTWTLWDEWRDCDDSYGRDYPGRMPGQIVENLLHYLTDPGDCVLDPMAGSGTTRDVCHALGRRCFCADANPLPDLEFIRQHAIPPEGTMPPTPGTVRQQGGYQLVLLDPPYWKQAEYGKSPKVIGAVGDFDAYRDWVGNIIAAASKAVRPGGYVAVIASMTRRQNQVYQPMTGWVARGEKAGLAIWDWIIVPYTSARASGADVSQAERDRRLLRRHRDLIVMGKPK